MIESAGPAISIGRLCHIENHERRSTSRRKWSDFATIAFCSCPRADQRASRPGAIVTSTSEQLRVPVGNRI